MSRPLRTRATSIPFHSCRATGCGRRSFGPAPVRPSPAAPPVAPGASRGETGPKRPAQPSPAGKSAAARRFRRRESGSSRGRTLAAADLPRQERAANARLMRLKQDRPGACKGPNFMNLQIFRLTAQAPQNPCFSFNLLKYRSFCDECRPVKGESVAHSAPQAATPTALDSGPFGPHAGTAPSMTEACRLHDSGVPRPGSDRGRRSGHVARRRQFFGKPGPRAAADAGPEPGPRLQAVGRLAIRFDRRESFREAVFL